MKSYKAIDDWDCEILDIKLDPNRKRPKESVWDAVPEEDERPRFGSRKKKVYTPINFVSGGLRETAEEERKAQQKARGGCDDIQSGVAVGDWEQHTKGIGLKIMLKMGYQPGKGLGKYNQGILKPVESKGHHGKGAVGAFENESLPDLPVINSKEVEDPAGPGGKERPKSSYTTQDELKAKGKLAGRSTATSAGELAEVKVIDMAGREHTLYYSYSQMSNKHSVTDEGSPSLSTQDQKGSGFALPELDQILQLDLPEQDILQSARHLHHEKDVLVSLKHESQVLQNRLDAEEDAIQRLEAVLALVKHFPTEEMAPGEAPTLQECARIFESLQTDFYEEYEMMGLADLAAAVDYPLTDSAHPLLDPPLETSAPIRSRASLPTNQEQTIQSPQSSETPVIPPPTSSRKRRKKKGGRGYV